MNKIPLLVLLLALTIFGIGLWKWEHKKKLEPLVPASFQKEDIGPSVVFPEMPSEGWQGK